MGRALAIAAWSWIGASSAFAQTTIGSVDQLRRELAIGDRITAVTAAGQPVAGRLIRIGDADLEVRLVPKAVRGPRDVTIVFADLQSLERPRDPARNGAIRGALAGAAAGGALFVYALAVDRDELDEWAGLYLGMTAAATGIGTLIGWAIDAAHSKPHLRFAAPSARRTSVAVTPLYSPRRGIGIAVSVSR